ncbi:MAG: cation transporter [Bacteroidia bacterium]|nr:cation transporter [Bacteroidia bacterium]
MNTQAHKARINLMKFTVIVGFVLMGIKFCSWYFTKSNAILTDALESIINVVAGAFALYSLYYAAKPRDEDHPYGHGKIEFFSAGIEGSLIFIAGLSMVAKAVYGFFHPAQLDKIDLGVALSAFTALVNFFLGRHLLKTGRQSNNAVLIADGKHLVSDTISTIGLIAGLLIIFFTGKFWLDNLVTILLGCWIIFTGFKLVRESVGNLLDEADMEVVNSLIEILNVNRKQNWIDIHNLRVLKYGSHLHIDMHATFPYYMSLEESHEEVHAIENLIKEKTGNEVELFIHADPCIESSCAVCLVNNCPVRKFPFREKLEWKLENVLPDAKHK